MQSELLTKMRAAAAGFSGSGVLFLALLGYYAWFFGFDQPWNESLFGDYTVRRYRTHGILVRQNVPLLPDKFVTLAGLAGTALLLIRRWWLRRDPDGNFFVRLLLVAAVVLLVPVSLYLLTYCSVLVAIGLVLFIVYSVLRLAIRYVVQGTPGR